MMKKIYSTPAFKAIDIDLNDSLLLTGSDKSVYNEEVNVDDDGNIGSLSRDNNSNLWDDEW